jgi:hypothetical protein
VGAAVATRQVYHRAAAEPDLCLQANKHYFHEVFRTSRAMVMIPSNRGVEQDVFGAFAARNRAMM